MHDELIPNYRVLSPTLAMWERETQCCASCSHVTIYRRKCNCNYLRYALDNSKQSRKSQVNYNGICDRYEDGDIIRRNIVLSQ